MKPLAFDLRGAKKTSGDKHSSTFHLKNGHMLTIAHAPLSALQRKQLEKMPVKMADGGDVGSQDSDVFMNNSRAINRNMMGKQKESDDDQEDDLTGDERESMYRGESIQGNPVDMGHVESENIPAFANGGMASSDEGDSGEAPSEIDNAAMSGQMFGFKPSQLDDKTGIRQFPAPGDQATPAIDPNAQSQYLDSVMARNPADMPSSNDALRAQAFDAVDHPTAIPKPNANDPYGTQGYLQQQMNAMNQQQAGQMQENAVNSMGAHYRAGLEGQYQAAAQAPLQIYQQQMAHLNDQSEKIYKEVSDGAIDPSHYVKNMSTGSKIATAFGLLAGGVFSARTGQANPAFSNLQDNIKRDIDSQKVNLGQKNTLLNFNLARTNNLTAAEQLTAFQTNAIFESKFRQAAQQATNQMEQAKNLQIAGMFGQKKAELAHQISVQQAMLGGQPGQSSEQAFQNRMQYLRMNGQDKMADEMEKKHVPGLPGAASTEVTPQNRDEYRTLSNLQKSYNAAQDYMNNVGRMGAGYQNANKARGQSIMDAMTLQMGELADLKRFTPEEKKLYIARVPDLTGTHFTGQDQALLSQLQKELSDKSNTFKTSLGYPGSRAPVNQSPNSNNMALNWARQNPKDPRAARILKKLGVK